ncbi:hypothetical protein [Vibrio sp. 10N.261.55.A7]|nr:hypothetical protein [Vibrio sp. 10N.261.55.A7]
MKHFLPSSVMLTPFVVKYYEDSEENDVEEETLDKKQNYTNLNRDESLE